MPSILIIDDERDVRATIRRVLERADYRVLEAGDGREALEVASSTPCDLVITDINMPEMDGIEVIMTLAEKTPGLPVIAISGGGKLPKELLLASADLLGAVTTLSKPFEISELLDAVRTALESRG